MPVQRKRKVVNKKGTRLYFNSVDVFSAKGTICDKLNEQSLPEKLKILVDNLCENVQPF